MILFVDHHAVLFARIDGDGSRSIGIGDLAADQLSFDQELPIDLGQLFDIDVADVFPVFDRIHSCPNRAFDTDSVFVAAAADEGKVGEVSGQPNPTADHDVRFGTGPPQPFSAACARSLKSDSRFTLRSPRQWLRLPDQIAGCRLPSLLESSQFDHEFPKPVRSPLDRRLLPFHGRRLNHLGLRVGRSGGTPGIACRDVRPSHGCWSTVAADQQRNACSHKGIRADRYCETQRS